MFDSPSVTAEKSDKRIPGTFTAQLTERRAENWTRWVAMHWPEVSVAETTLALTRIAGRPRLQAQACVTLGLLLPADVHVEALPDSGGGSVTLFSAATLRGGRYRYVANAAAGEGDAHRTWTIRVSPAREMRVGDAVAPVAVPVELESPGAVIAGGGPEMTRGIGQLQEVAS